MGVMGIGKLHMGRHVMEWPKIVCFFAQLIYHCHRVIAITDIRQFHVVWTWLGNKHVLAAYLKVFILLFLFHFEESVY